MNVLIGCTGPASPVERLVVKSSQAVYGAGATDPSFLSEDMASTERLGGSFVTRDLRDMEQLVAEYADRSSTCRVTVLRLGYRVAEDTKLAKYLLLPVVPNVCRLRSQAPAAPRRGRGRGCRARHDRRSPGYLQRRRLWGRPGQPGDIDHGRARRSNPLSIRPVDGTLLV